MSRSVREHSAIVTETQIQLISEKWGTVGLKMEMSGWGERRVWLPVCLAQPLGQCQKGTVSLSVSHFCLL